MGFNILHVLFKIKISVVLFFIAFFTASAQNDSIAVRYAQTIRSEDLKKHLVILASDAYEGRETGTKGQKMAAAYISDQFKNFGIPPVNGSYYQEYFLVSKETKGVQLKIRSKEYQFLKDFYCWPGYVRDQKARASRIVFLGYGAGEEDYKDSPVENNVVLILSEDSKEENKRAALLKKVSLASKHKAKALLIVDASSDSTIKRYRHYLESPSINLEDNKADASSHYPPVVHISVNTANDLLAAKELSIEKIKLDVGRYKKLEIKAKFNLQVKRMISKIKAENVLGYVEGSDLKEELIVVSAHYDHLGKKDDKIYNGADDDGSGTVALIELAEAFMKAKKEGHGPRRSVLFLPFSGEEMGLLGSRYYTDNPLFPLKNTVADLNIDMIGRMDEKYKNDPDYVYIIGSDKLSTDLHLINEEANKKYTQLQLDYTYNDLNDKNRFYYRSDHYNFAKNNIPVIFYFNGVHEDYHKETDEVDKIHFQKIEKITQLIFYTAWQLSNRDARIKVDVKQ